MGAAEETHSAVDSYGREVSEMAQSLRAMSRKLDHALSQLHGQSALGGSTHPRLEKARTRLGAAKRGFLDAAQATEASAKPARSFAQRVLPP